MWKCKYYLHLFIVRSPPKKHFQSTPQPWQIECMRGIQQVFNRMTFIISNFQQETLSYSSRSSMHNTASANGVHELFLYSIFLWWTPSHQSEALKMGDGPARSHAFHKLVFVTSHILHSKWWTAPRHPRASEPQKRLIKVALWAIGIY